MREDDKIHLVSTSNGIVSMSAGLRLCVYKGEMDYNVGKGRVPRVSRQPVFIQFRNNNAFVGRDGTDAIGQKVDLWKILGANTRAEAKEAIKRIRGFGGDFTFADDEVEAKTGRPVAAAG